MTPKHFPDDLLKDPDFLRLAHKRWEEGWTFEKAEPLSTEELLARLARFGVNVSAEQFARAARRHDSAESLKKEWEKTCPIKWTHTLEDDFVWVAAYVLWKRLVPDHISFEQINEEMQGGYDLLEAGKTDAACDKWWQAWQWIREKVTPATNTLAVFDKAFLGTQSVFNWCQDFEMELGNAGLEDPAYHKLRIRYCQELLSTFTAIDWEMRNNFLRAEADAYWYLGETETAEQKFAALIAQNPDWAWGYVAWSDHFWLDCGAPKNHERAEELLQQALARPNLEDRDAVLERLRDLRKETPGSAAPALATPPDKPPSPSAAWDMRKWKKKRRNR